MASNNFGNGKIHGASEAKAKFGHTTKDERMRRRHSNKNIDKSMTHLNTSVHEMLTGHEYTYVEMCEIYDRRIAELDAIPGQSKRKDRVTLQAIETPAPADLPAEQQDAWFLRVAQIQMAIFGEENYLDGHIDRDEQHEYMDAQTKQMVTSRVHMVSYLFPVVHDANGNEKLNCKKFSRRANINRLNKEVEQMTVDEFGIHFMTGAKTKSKKTVEQLKRESEIAEMEAKSAQLEQVANDITEALKWHAAVEKQTKQMEEELEEHKEAMAKRERQLNQRETAISEQEKNVKEQAKRNRLESQKIEQRFEEWNESEQRKATLRRYAVEQAALDATGEGYGLSLVRTNADVLREKMEAHRQMQEWLSEMDAPKQHDDYGLSW